MSNALSRKTKYHRHLHHFVGVRVVHEGPALHQLKLVDEGLVDTDMGLSKSADTVHAARQ
jgi:hypothetical protein